MYTGAYPKIKFRRKRSVAKEIDKYLEKLHQSVDIGLHLGAGGKKIVGLVNCDLFDSRADQAVDAMNLVDYEDGSVDLIESPHMIEHLSFIEAETAIREWNRALKVGGLLVITCPNITSVCWLWVMQSVKHYFKDQMTARDYTAKMLM